MKASNSHLLNMSILYFLRNSGCNLISIAQIYSIECKEQKKTKLYYALHENHLYFYKWAYFSVCIKQGVIYPYTKDKHFALILNMSTKLCSITNWLIYSIFPTISLVLSVEQISITITSRLVYIWFKTFTIELPTTLLLC